MKGRFFIIFLVETLACMVYNPAIRVAVASGVDEPHSRPSTIGIVQQQGATNGLSPELKQLFLTKHNDLRSQVESPTAANMVQMEWDDSLAEMAQGWSARCIFDHGNPPNISPYTYVGQNIFFGTGTKRNYSRVIEKWYKESAMYDYETNSCSGMCGHYTQIVWAETTSVGCGVTFCPQYINLPIKSTMVVCNYGKGGNFIGQKPYVSGPPCSQCPSSHPRCVDGRLCAKELAN